MMTWQNCIGSCSNPEASEGSSRFESSQPKKVKQRQKLYFENTPTNSVNHFLLPLEKSKKTKKMSWLARSLVNSLRLDDDDEDDLDNHQALENDNAPTTTTTMTSTIAVTNASRAMHGGHYERTKSLPAQSEQQQQEEREQDDDDLQSRGVREDLTELRETLAQQLWGVASFLAPPPTPSDQSTELRANLERSEMRTADSVEVGGGLKAFGSEREETETETEEENEEEEDGNCAVGLTEEVLAFARNIAMHPETWLDFPLDPDEDLDDLEMTNAQQEHALAIAQMSPRLNALRIELCPCHMSESYFWKVYFVLLHSRLNKQDAEILTTSQVMEARSMWMQELQKQTKPETDWYGRSTSYVKDSVNELHEDLSSPFYNAPSESFSPRTYGSEPTTSTMTTEYETEKHLVESTEAQFVDKSVIEEGPVTKTEDKDIHFGPSSKISIPHFEDDDDDDWPEEDSDLGGYSGNIICNEEDVSFSDLEADDDVRFPIKTKTLAKETTCCK